MIATEQIKVAVIAAHGRESAAVLGARYGLTRNQVIGIWHRRPRDTPEEKAKVAEREALAAAAAQAPFTPESAPFTGQAGAAWRALLAAGTEGADLQTIAAAMFPVGTRPASWTRMLHDCLRRLRSTAEPEGFTVTLVKGGRPSRWRILRLGEDPAPIASAVSIDAPTPVDVAPAPAPAAPPALPLVRGEHAPPLGLSGAAAAVASLRHGCCRWPIGEPGGPDFRFCNEPARDEGNPYCPEHRRVASAGQWSARRVA